MSDIVLELQRRKGTWRQLAKVSGVPYFTLSKIARGTIVNPSIQTVNKLLPHLDRHKANRATTAA